MDTVETRPEPSSGSIYAALAYQLWCKDSNKEQSIVLERRGRRKRVMHRIDCIVDLAIEFELTYTVVHHPRNRWWSRALDVSVVLHGTCGDLVQFLNVLDEVVTEERAR